MLLIPDDKARAYVNFGRWVADCPTRCGSAIALTPRQTIYHCIECHSVSEVDWPPNADEIMAALEKRPAPRTRNWFPAAHELALRANSPHGQTVEELNDETFDHLGEV